MTTYALSWTNRSRHHLCIHHPPILCRRLRIAVPNSVSRSRELVSIPPSTFVGPIYSLSLSLPWHTSPCLLAHPETAQSKLSSTDWVNGFLSMFDSAGFDRFAGASARKYTRDNYGLLARSLLACAPKASWKIIHGVVKKDFVATMKRRNASIQDERSTDVVYRMAREQLASLDALLEASPSDYFAGAASPTAADLTLYAMLERWVGDSMQPGIHGPSQPQILDGLPAIERMYSQVKAAWSVDLTRCKDYPDLVVPLGDVTYPNKKADELDVDIKGRYGG